jgi:hypothetical protein
MMRSECEEVLRDPAAHPAPQACDAQGVQRGRHSGEQRADRVLRTTERVRDACKAAARSHHRPGREAPEAQGVQVEHVLRFWVCRQENLKAAVEQEAVDAIGAHASSDVGIRLQQEDPEASFLQVQRAAQTGDAGTHDHDRLALRAHARAFPRSVISSTAVASRASPGQTSPPVLAASSFSFSGSCLPRTSEAPLFARRSQRTRPMPPVDPRTR